MTTVPSTAVNTFETVDEHPLITKVYLDGLSDGQLDNIRMYWPDLNEGDTANQDKGITAKVLRDWLRGIADNRIVWWDYDYANIAAADSAAGFPGTPVPAKQRYEARLSDGTLLYANTGDTTFTAESSSLTETAYTIPNETWTAWADPDNPTQNELQTAYEAVASASDRTVGDRINLASDPSNRNWRRYDGADSTDVWQPDQGEASGVDARRYNFASGTHTRTTPPVPGDVSATQWGVGSVLRRTNLGGVTEVFVADSTTTSVLQTAETVFPNSTHPLTTMPDVSTGSWLDGDFFTLLNTSEDPDKLEHFRIDTISSLLTAVQIDYDGGSGGGGAGGGSVAVQEEGSTLTSEAASINFVGTEMTATNAGQAVTVTHVNRKSDADDLGDVSGAVAIDFDTGTYDNKRLRATGDVTLSLSATRSGLYLLQIDPNGNTINWPAVSGTTPSVTVNDAILVVYDKSTSTFHVPG